MKTFKLFLFFLTTGFIWLAKANANQHEQTGAGFLLIPVEARNIGLGQASSALSVNCASLNKNVGGLSVVQEDTQYKSSLSFSHQSPFSDSNFDQIGFVFPVKKWTYGVNLVRLSYPEFDARTEDRSSAGTFSAQDLAVGLAFGSRFGPVYWGLQPKWIQQKLAQESASGPALDIGFLGYYRSISLGLSARNLGPSLRFINDEYRLPSTISLATGLRLLAPLILSFELQSRLYTNDFIGNFGIEFQAGPALSLRAGYLRNVVSHVQSNKNVNLVDSSFGLGEFSGGIGIKIQQFLLDYAVAPYGQYGQSHAITISAQFGRSTSSDSQTSNTTNPQPDPTKRQHVIFGN